MKKEERNRAEQNRTKKNSSWHKLVFCVPKRKSERTKIFKIKFYLMFKGLRGI